MPISPTDPANPDDFDLSRFVQQIPEAPVCCEHGVGLGADCADCARARAPMLPRRGGKGHPQFLKLVDEMRDLHVVKSGGYGTGDDPFANFTAVSAVTGRARYEYPPERIVEKVTRLNSLVAQGRTSELLEEFKDIAGLALCGAAMLIDDEPDARAG